VIEYQLGNQDLPVWHKLEIEKSGVARVYIGSDGANGIVATEHRASHPDVVVDLCNSLSRGTSFDGVAALGFPSVEVRSLNLADHRTRTVTFPVKITSYPFDWVHDRRILHVKEFDKNNREIKLFLDQLEKIFLHFDLTSDYFRRLGS
jgi:hypothetical protein